MPFLFVSSSAFQSMFYGQTNRKIRSYFKALRKHARREGGAIGFIEEIDAIGGARGGIGPAPRRGRPRGGQRAADPAAVLRAAARSSLRIEGALIDAGQRLAARRPPAATSRSHAPANILVIGATNRAADLDPALLRPGPLRPHHLLRPAQPVGSPRDHRLLPGQEGPRGRARRPGQARDAGRPDRRVLAGDDRAPAGRGAGLGAAPRRRPALVGRPPAGQDDRGDRPGPAGRVHRGRAPDHRHPRGRATPPWPGWSGKGRKLEVLSIIKRKDALGLLSHSEEEERFTKTTSEIAGAHRHRLRRHGGRGALLRRGLAPAWPATSRPPPSTPARWSGSSAWAAP